MDVERRPTYALDKNINFLKKKLLRLLHISSMLKNVSIIAVHYVIIIGTTVGCVFNASCGNKRISR